MINNKILFRSLMTMILVTGYLFPTGGYVQAEENDPPIETQPEVSVQIKTPDENSTDPDTSNSVSSDPVVDPPPVESDGNLMELQSSTPEEGEQPEILENPATVPPDTVNTPQALLPEAVDTPLAFPEGSDESAEPLPQEDETEGSTQSNLMDVVQTLADMGAVLMQDDEPLSLASKLAADSLEKADPYFTRGGVTYHYYQTGATCAPGTENITCFVSDTPIQDAINKYATITPLAGEENTIYVLPGTYEENITIAVPNLTLYGNPGDLTSAGAGLGAPVLQGTSGTGIDITGEGVQIIGFIIQGYDTAIVVNVVSGKNSVYITNNTITENDTGIRTIKQVGSPGTEIHYNSIFGNGVGLENNKDNNIQFVEAQDNYWGCETGPVVYGSETTGPPNSRRTGYWQWPAGEYLGTTLPENCQLLDGYQVMWDFQKGTSDWSPYKINLGATVPPTETPEPTTVTPEPTTETPEPTTETPEPTTETPPPAPPAPPIVPVTGPAFFIPVTGGARIIAAGLDHTCMTIGNEVACWGLNASGQLGNGNYEDQKVPRYVSNLTNVIDLTAGRFHTCALTETGEVWCWGDNSSGQLGDGTTRNSNVPVLVGGLPGSVIDFTAGNEFTCAKLKNNEIWCWGNNEFGQLNDGTKINRSKPVKALIVDNNLISGGHNELVSNAPTGEVEAWQDKKTELIRDVLLPQAISANRFASGGCVSTLAGMVKCWSGDYAAEQIDGITSALQVVTGYQHSCTIHEDLTISCWGGNALGELGNGTTQGSTSGVHLQNMQMVQDLALGEHHTCVLAGASYTAYCWGDNALGQLGNNSTINSSIPVMVALPVR
jgi:alpha-tubulin suppressor-like RCC1 family protein